MKLSSALLAASVGLAVAHSERSEHLPKILGGRKFLSELVAKRKEDFGEIPSGPRHANGRSLERRQDDGEDDQCGPGIGACADGECCSAEGWCGIGYDYCTAPDCQINYGSGCDANQKPAGLDTSGVARPKLGDALYGGEGIYDCVNPGDIAITFDDGPYLYTNDLLDKLESYGAKATFFITGTNIGKGQINDPTTIYPEIIRRMHADGHQIASHTWSHQNASQLTNDQFKNQMIWNEIALNSILGFFPAYMRPPFSICEANCQTILETLGYHAIYFDLDTEGYLHDDPTQIQTSKDIWDTAIKGADPESDNYLQIEHDIHYQTVYNLTDYILTSLVAAGFNAVTVGECLGDPVDNWYRAGPDGSVTVPTTSVPLPTITGPVDPGDGPTRTTISLEPTGTGTSTDGSCGRGVSCLGTEWGDCCSVFGWCGSSDDYCSPDKCQPDWGTCSGGSASSVTTTPAPTTSSTTKPPASSTTTSSSSTTSKPPASSSSTKSTSTSTKPSSTKTTTSTPSSTGLPISTDGTCGSRANRTCKGSTFGKCCSSSNKCTSSSLSCIELLGCQPKYGTCSS
ncbi:uncharacterized protein C8A04DRAFT_34602 [Dichotomopilus funicola]|uniref:Chitin deacetylase n=1 Tax=Dichotomopilus funicola TaxID=1934379 RepID=A0AAN6V8X9_9PEZI|nr:hypothetical protein C8A04DRAFT_34602 [Dichotomopilus funicola]